MKLRAFIGSSAECLNVANAIKNNLQEIDATVWTDSFFKLSRSTLDNLSAQLDEFDLGIFIFGEDDTVASRGTSFSAPRDNVIFEHGLFCGRLGPQRTFVVRAKSGTLKWLSDLVGFTPAAYDEKLAMSNAEEAVKEACNEIRNTLRDMVPRPGLFRNGRWIGLRQDWWTYGASEDSSTVADEEGVQLFAEKNVGLKFPRADNLGAKGRFCAIRIKSISDARVRRFYVSLKTTSTNVLLSLSDSHASEGWGTPQNEFMIRVPRLEVGRYQCLTMDLRNFEAYLGPISAINGFRVGPDLKVSHFCVCDVLPPWLESAADVRPTDAPLITIEHPGSDARVGRDELIEGTLSNLRYASGDDLQVFVRSPNLCWYPQPGLAIANGRWQVKAIFGLENEVGDYFLAAITTDGKPTRERKVDQLPTARGRSPIVRVIRKK